ncbi:hypothetical protein K1719_017816 [Acacia pycnantha]|nr:hypothetical protein K1719_017816 [Acacia pycnantha]
MVREKEVANHTGVDVVAEGSLCDGDKLAIVIGPSCNGPQDCGPSISIDPPYDPGAPSEGVVSSDLVEVGPVTIGPSVNEAIEASLNNEESVLPETQIGACGKGLIRNLRVLCKGPKPSLIALAKIKIENVTHLPCLESLGFDEVRVIPSSGRSGGLAVAWDTSRIIINIIEEERQFFHLHCSSASSPAFFLTTVYAIPHSNLRSVLWENLQRLSQSISIPWSIIGDFNDILSSGERSGGRGSNSSRMKWFQDRINNCGFVSLGSVGPKMTWKGPKIAGCTRLFERLDRAFANGALLGSWPDSFVKNPPSSTSMATIAACEDAGTPEE